MAKIVFTAGRVTSFRCPVEKGQAFLWDLSSKGLGLRATPLGKPAYVFQGVFQGKDLRITIGNPEVWPIPLAREKARELQRLIDEGRDPREVKAAKIAVDVASREAATAIALTVGELWPIYLLEGKPKRRDEFKPRYLADLALMVTPGGVKKRRGQGKTRPGPIYPLLELPLSSITEDSLKSWFDNELIKGKHQATRALMMFRGFLRWCSARPEYRNLFDRDAGRAPAIMEVLPRVKKRTDCLESGQLKGWFGSVEKLENRTMATYLKCLLLTGARREDIAALKWIDIDFRWRKLALHDKYEKTRVIPLSPYVAKLIASMPRKQYPDGTLNPFVFTANSISGHVADPRECHLKVQTENGIVGLTLHGLRRTFSLQGEAAGAPQGAIAQVMGHQPSAVAEGYRPRSMDALRPYLERIESHILKLAGISVVVPEIEATIGKVD